MVHKYNVEILLNKSWAEWDSFVDQTPQGTIFHRSEWLTAILNDPNALSIMVCRNKSGNIVAGLPLIRRSVRYFRVFQSPPLCPYTGPVITEPIGEKISSRNTEQKEKMLALLDAIPSGDLLRFALSPSNADTMPFSWHGYHVNINHTYRIATNSQIDVVWNQIDAKQRNVIRKAEKDGVVIKTCENVEELLPLIRKTYTHQGMELPQDPAIYKRIWKMVRKNQRGTIHMAYGKDGNPQYGMMTVWDKKMTYLLLSGIDRTHHNTGAGSLTLWTAIKETMARGQIFDFEGSTMPGVERFYRSYGGEMCSVITVEKIRSPVLRLWISWRDHRYVRSMEKQCKVHKNNG
jgi:hypothetical protein